MGVRVLGVVLVALLAVAPGCDTGAGGPASETPSPPPTSPAAVPSTSPSTDGTPTVAFPVVLIEVVVTGAIERSDRLEVDFGSGLSEDQLLVAAVDTVETMTANVNIVVPADATEGETDGGETAAISFSFADADGVTHTFFNGRPGACSYTVAELGPGGAHGTFTCQDVAATGSEPPVVITVTGSYQARP